MTRRSVLAACAAAVLLVAGAEGQTQFSPRPNILIIQADDLGYGDLSVYGQTKFSTPSLDRLAREGIAVHELLRRQHGVRAVTRRAHDRPAHRPRLDPRQRPVAAARRGRHDRDVAEAGGLSHRAHRQVGTRPARHVRPAGSQGLRVLVRLHRPAARPPAVHRSPLPQRGAGTGEPGGLRQRSLHPRNDGVHRAGRPASVLSSI